MVRLCGLCEDATESFRTTLYDLVICDACHDLLKGKDLKSDIEKLEKNLTELRGNLSNHQLNKREEKVDRKRHWELMTIPKTADKLPSETRDRLLKESKFLRFVSFFSVNLFYRAIGKELEEKIVSEANKNKSAQESRINKKYDDLLKREEGLAAKYVENKTKKAYTAKYLKIIKKVRLNDIKLYEYYRGEYPSDWPVRRQAVIKRDQFKCTSCGATERLHVHHKVHVNAPHVSLSFSQRKLIVDRTRLGDHFLDNLVTVCASCHLDEHPSILRKRGVQE